MGRFKKHKGPTLRFTLLAVAALALAALLWLSVRRPERPVAKVAIQFAGYLDGGIHRNPFGQFILTNQSDQTIEWSRSHVEAPGDSDIGFAESLDSNFEMGALSAGAVVKFRALVPHAKGGPFRVVLNLHTQPTSLDRLRSKFPSPLPVIDSVWPRFTNSITFTSQWFTATTDYPVNRQVDEPPPDGPHAVPSSAHAR